jgi:hypothetical protein
MAAITYPLSATHALQEVRVNLNETTAAFWTDEEINNWVIMGASDVALKGLGVIKMDTVTLATSTLTYTAMTTAGAGGVAKILRVIGAAYDTTYKGLIRIHPIQLKHLTNTTAGPPDYYFHYNTVFGVYPVPTGSEAAKLVTVWYSEAADGVDDLPNHHQHFCVWYATAMAYLKANKNTHANYWMSLYLNGITMARNDLYNLPPDSIDMLTIPDRTVAAGR